MYPSPGSRRTRRHRRGRPEALIASGMTSARNRRQLVVVRDSLAPYRSNPEARDTIELLDHHVA